MDYLNLKIYIDETGDDASERVYKLELVDFSGETVHTEEILGDDFEVYMIDSQLADLCVNYMAHRMGVALMRVDSHMEHFGEGYQLQVGAVHVS